jgi:adenylate kinase
MKGVAMTPVNLILLGPPGVGKSTQAQLLGRRYPLVSLSTGSILRAEVAAQTPLGLQAQATIERGVLVGDDLIVALVRSRMEALPADHGFVLDGFPRTIAQATALDALLHQLYRPLTLVAQPVLERDEMVRRMSSRRECRACNAPTTLTTTQRSARCPACGGALVQRPDDMPDVIARRLDVYERQTAPLAAYYQRSGLLMSIDAHGEPEQVAARLANAIELQRVRRRAEPLAHARALSV